MFQLHLKIHGKVQGVFFRETVLEEANELGLVGYVKNMSDGTVEVIAEGEEETLKKLLEWCKIGPRLAQVRNVNVGWQDMDVLCFKNFEIRF